MNIDLTNPAVAGFVGVIVGAVIAGLVNIGGELLRGWQASRLDTKKRRDDRQLSLDEFQRNTLVDVQDTMNEMLRAAMAIHMVYVRQSRAGGQWGGIVGDDLAEAERIPRQRLATLRTRVQDQPLRGDLHAFTAASTEGMLAQSEADADAANETAMMLARRIMERSGELVRATFLGTDIGLPAR